MPTRRQSPILKRAQYARTTGDLLVNDPDGFPSDVPPIWWYGLDSGGGAYPIGPNGPWTDAQAEGLPVVTRATSLVVGPLSAAPYRVSTDAPPVGVFEQSPRWITDPMLLRPDARFLDVYPAALKLSRSEFWGSWIRSALWWGLGVFLCTEDEAGAPMAGSLKLVDPRMVWTERHDDGLRWVIGDDHDQTTFSRDGYLTLGPVTYRIVVLRNPHSPVDVEGMSRGVFALSPSAFKLSGQIDTYASGTFRSGIPAGYLQVETPGLQQDDATDLKARWLASHGGDRRSIAVLNATTKFVPLNLSPVDAALVEVKRLSVADVAFAFGLDPYTLGVSLGNSATYNNLTDAWRQHRDFGLSPWIAAVDDTLSALTPTGSTVAVNLDGFANPTTAERFAAYKIGIDAGFIDADDVRTIEGLPPKSIEKPHLSAVPDDAEEIPA